MIRLTSFLTFSAAFLLTAPALAKEIAVDISAVIQTQEAPLDLSLTRKFEMDNVFIPNRETDKERCLSALSADGQFLGEGQDQNGVNPGLNCQIPTGHPAEILVGCAPQSEIEISTILTSKDVEGAELWPNFLFGETFPLVMVSSEQKSSVIEIKTDGFDPLTAICGDTGEINVRIGSGVIVFRNAPLGLVSLGSVTLSARY